MIRKTIQIALVTTLALSFYGCRKPPDPLGQIPPVNPTYTGPEPRTPVEPITDVAPDNDIKGPGKRPSSIFFAIPEDTVKTVYFDYDNSGIRPDQRAALEATAEFLKTKPTWKIRIDGHCDERGTLEYNMALGGRRADSVVAFLVSRGVPPENLLVASRGEEEPAVAGTGEAVWAKNRRAVFFYSVD